MPTSVLLAVLAAAGLLALAPALTRRHDSTERLAAERATSTARVLSRRRRRRTVPGPRPINPPRFVAMYRGGSAYRGGQGGLVRPYDTLPGLRDASGVRDASVAEGRRPGEVRAYPGTGRREQNRRPITALQRRRRVFLALVLLNLVELAGVVLVGPGFWIGFAVTFALLLADLAYLRHRAVVTERLRQSTVAPGTVGGQATGRGTPGAGVPGIGASGGGSPRGGRTRGGPEGRGSSCGATYRDVRNRGALLGRSHCRRQRSGPAEPEPGGTPRAGLRGRAYETDGRKGGQW